MAGFLHHLHSPLRIEIHPDLFDLFHALLTGEDAGADPDPELGKLAIFAGVREYPVRVKCATLAWHTLKAALEQSAEAVTTE